MIDRRKVLRLGVGLSALVLLAACDTTSLNFAPGGAPSAATGQSFGTGPVKVALLLPLSGDPGTAAVGTSMANAAQLAMDYVAASSRIGDNITLSIKDTGVSAQGATARAREAVAEGDSLILGPLLAEQVAAAGAVARGANIPLIGFSNNSAVAAPGVYLLNVLPEAEIHRSLGYARDHGHKTVAALFPNSAFGRAQQAAFQSGIADLGITPAGTYTFTNENDAGGIVAQLAPQLKSGAIETLFLPDRPTAPSLATLLQQNGVPPGRVLIVGSADWDGDPQILATPYLAGAVYPAVDDTGFKAMTPDYQQKFGSAPNPLSTIAYTATILANAPQLAQASPPYNPAAMTLPGGFNGRDGVFRFLPNGQSQYALVMKQITANGAIRVDGPKL